MVYPSPPMFMQHLDPTMRECFLFILEDCGSIREEL